MVDMNVKLANWKNRLLDLGKRNRLLNYRDTRRSSLKIKTPKIFELWNDFIINENPLVFPYYDEEILETVDNEFIKEIASVATNQSLKDQQKTLRNLRNKAKTFMEEQGINVLYLSFGFLRWSEAEHSKVQFDAPLILVPVTISWESITSPFVLSLREDEIILNPTLVYKLENDFGLKLPDFSIDDDLQDYFTKLQNIVVNNHWEIIAEVGLSLLSFLKINMYRDLEKHQEDILANPVIKAISGEANTIEYDSALTNIIDHDNDKESIPEKTFQILDADASQLDAIYCAKKGLSFVLQGPPGTGKSQTITNIIAECLAAGKKVLFVSEKMAALEVVHNRLTTANLADFCLILHSHKANKKQMLAQLGEVINLTQKKISVNDDIQQKFMQLNDDKQKLNSYANAIHTVIEPLHKTIYEVNGYLAQLQKYEEVIFPIPEVRQTSAETYQRYINVLNALCSVIAKMPNGYLQNPWYGADIPYLNNELRHDISSLGGRLLPKLQNLVTICNDIAKDCSLVFSDGYNALPGIVQLLRVAAQSPGTPVDWVKTENSHSLTEKGQYYADMQQRIAKQQNNVNSLRLSLNVAVALNKQFDLTSAAGIAILQTELKNIIIADACWQVWNQFGNTETAEKMLTLLNENITKYRNLTQQVAAYFIDTVYNIDFTTVYKHFTDLYKPEFLTLCKQYEQDRKQVISCYKELDAQSSNDDLQAFLSKVCRYNELQAWVAATPKIEQYNALNQEINADYEKEIAGIDYNAMYLRFKTASQSFTKLFNSQYKADKATILSLRRKGGKKIDDTEVIDILSKMRRQEELRLWLDASAEYNQYNQLHKELTAKIDESAFSMDLNAVYNRFKLDYTAEFIDLYRQYQADLVLLQQHSQREVLLTNELIFEQLTNLHNISDIRKFLTDNEASFTEFFGSLYQQEQTDIVAIRQQFEVFHTLKNYQMSLQDLLEQLKNYESQEPKIKRLFGMFYQGLQTDWNYIQDCLVWADKFRATLDKQNLMNSVYVDGICAKNEIWQKNNTYLEQLESLLANMETDLQWFVSLFETAESLLAMPVPALTERVADCLNNTASLEDWLDFRVARNRCVEAGLADYIFKIEERGIVSKNIVGIFQKRFFRLWLDSILPETPIVAQFRRWNQTQLLQEFGELDKLQFAIAKSRIRSILINSLPSLDRLTSGVDEISILKREMNKQRKIMPIRRLFKEIPNLIMTLKPCLMMSPLSVSLFLEADSFKFDTVIFDEASQVCTENAIGAIFRGKQVIIAGDSKQLPPTNFFAAAVSDNDFDTDDDEEYDDSNAFESILDEAALLPERTLLWHYRSRHEHLIAFSNAKIYKNQLITFPSNIDKAPNTGVEYYYVPDGFYDRGGRKGNVVEAAEVAKLVFEHFQKVPERSLGVIAFGENQQQAIELAVRKMRLENQQFEEFFNEDRPEPFFIKSLENVQGDERDTIIFSIGYAKDAAGVMRMNFGPLSRIGGERRLNVAITRAKYNVKLVGSILPTDINIEKISSNGPKLLRSYIDFAMNGPEVLVNETAESDIVEHDSPFEEAVYNFLESKGYKLATQVGCSGYRIDMAVKHPTLSGRFVLGIECDGASYHSARTARERDRLRQDILEGMGWKIYRIWSTDWIKDPVSEGQRLLAAIEMAINNYSETKPQNILNTAPANQQVTETADFVTVEDKSADTENSDNIYGFTSAVDTDFKDMYKVPRDIYGKPKLSGCIKALVENEYPVHYDIVCQKLSFLFGRSRATSAVRAEIDYALQSMQQTIIKKGDFLYPADYIDIPVRQANGRPIKYISVDEIATAMLCVLGKCVGITKAGLIDETTRAYGFNRRGSNITNAMNEAYDLLLKQGKIKEVDGKVQIK